MDSLGRAGAATLTVLALAGLTGCAGARSSAGAGDPGVPSAAATAPSAPLDTGVPSAAATASPGTPRPAEGKPVDHRCPTAALVPGLIFQRAHDVLVDSLLVLTNRARPCKIQGAVSFTVLGPGNRPLSNVTDIKLTSTAIPLITLKTGDTAFSAVQWRAGPRCAQGIGLSYTAPGQGGRMPVLVKGFGGKATTFARFRICGRITVGALQTTSQGVNFP